MSDDFYLPLLNRFGLYYGMIDERLQLHFDNDAVCRFLSISPPVSDVPLESFFYEVIGLEGDIARVIRGEKRELCIKRISRGDIDEIYFDLYFIHQDKSEFPVIVMLRDITSEMLFHYSLQQSKNEIVLLQHELMDKNIVLDRINRELEDTVKLRTRQYQESSELANRLFIQTVNSLTYALEKRDPYTSGHQHRVAILASAIAENMGLDKHSVEGIRVAGALHDIGKIYIPSDFLTKPGRLSDEELNVIKTHPRVGFEILKDIEFPWPVASIVLQHHEKKDGSGYPYGLEGDEIMFEARILCVADVVEAMGTNRPYRISPGMDKAFEEIARYRGIKYEANVVDACMDVVINNRISWDEGY